MGLKLTKLFDLAGKTALITGSSRDLGRAAAEALAGAGARVIVNGVNLERLERAAQSMRSQGFDVLSAAFDVTDAKAITAAFAKFDSDGVAVDVLVNNAGVNERAPLVEMTEEDWRQVIDTNLTSAFLLSREAARRMLPRGHGKIINISSITSEIARPMIGPYAAAKGGLKQLTKVMAAEWASHGIQSNAIGPGMMLTDMNLELSRNDDFNTWLRRRVPAGRWGKPHELSGAVVFLASAASNFVNGQTLYVDGGFISTF